GSLACDIEHPLQLLCVRLLNLFRYALIICFLFTPLWLSSNEKVRRAVIPNLFSPNQQITIGSSRHSPELRNDHCIEFETFGFMNRHDLHMILPARRSRVQRFQTLVQQAEISNDSTFFERFDQPKIGFGVFAPVALK